VALPAVTGSALVLAMRFASEALRTKFDGLKLRLPLIGATLQKISLARFSSTLGMLYASSIPVLAALELSAGAAGNRTISRAVIESQAKIAEGMTIADSFESAGLFPRRPVNSTSLLPT
jgi:type IV pilus assembly protein PilC